jgi:hypothetical protein
MKAKREAVESLNLSPKEAPNSIGVAKVSTKVAEPETIQ